MLRRVIRLLEIAIRLFSRFLASLAGIALTGLVLVTIYGVVMRYFIRAPEAWPLEVGEFTLLVASSLAWAFVQQQRRHVRVETMVMKLPGKVQNVLDVVSLLSLLFYAGILAWAGYLLAMRWQDTGYRSIFMQIPMFGIGLLIPLGAVALGLQVLVDIKEAVARVVGTGKKVAGMGK